MLRGAGAPELGQHVMRSRGKHLFALPSNLHQQHKHWLLLTQSSEDASPLPGGSLALRISPGAGKSRWNYPKFNLKHSSILFFPCTKGQSSTDLRDLPVYAKNKFSSNEHPQLCCKLSPANHKLAQMLMPVTVIFRLVRGVQAD